MIKFLKLLSLVFLCLTIAHCGFQPRSDMSLPEQLRVIYVKSNNPYGQFEHSLKKSLKEVGITVVDSPTDAAILQILQTNLVSVPSSVGTGPQATVYTVTYTATIALYDTHNHLVMPARDVKSTSTMIVNAEQALSATNQLDIISQELQRDVITQIFAILSSGKIQQGMKRVD